MAEKQPKNQSAQKTQSNQNYRMWGIVVVLVLLLSFNIIKTAISSMQKIEVSYDQFIQLVETDAVKTVEVGETELKIILKDTANNTAVTNILTSNNTEQQNGIQKFLQQFGQQLTYYTGTMNDTNLINRLTEKNVKFYRITARDNSLFTILLSWVLPFLIIYLFYYWMIRRLQKRLQNQFSNMDNGNAETGGGFSDIMNNFGIGKSRAKRYDVEKNIKVTFADVAGQDEAKESLAEIVDFLHNPKKYESIGAKQPKGALLVGPPGTGKTLLARATAGEAKVAFYSLSGSEFIEMFAGVGASRVRDLFEQAKKNAPCIIFIDEIDAIGKSRDNQYGSNDEREQTLNQLLAEMDGFDSSKGIMVLAATNRPEILDKALLRPGRFDRRIIVEKPDLQGRIDILKVHSKDVKISEHVNYREIALATSGATGADLANMINEAALRAVRMNRLTVTQEDLMESVEVVIAGKEKKDRVMTEHERKVVAYHEVGHALVAALQKNAQPVQKITIVPRTMGALGYTMQMPEEERFLLSKEELLVQITILLGGRSAEEIIFGDITTGAANDIERATELARRMVTQYGMSDTFDMMALETTQSQYLDGRNVATVSEATGKAVDEEVIKIIQSCHTKAKNILKEHTKLLEQISAYLLEKETITGSEFMEILHTFEVTSA